MPDKPAKKPFREKTKGKVVLAAPQPSVKRIPMSEATKRGRTKPYVYASKCVKCVKAGDSGTLIEGRVFEATKWSYEPEKSTLASGYVKKKVFLCETHGKRAIALYKQKREEAV